MDCSGFVVVSEVQADKTDGGEKAEGGVHGWEGGPTDCSPSVTALCSHSDRARLACVRVCVTWDVTLPG